MQLIARDEPAEFAALSDYWQSLRSSRGDLPLRRDLDPREMESFLHCTLLLSRMASGDVRIRLGGESLCEFMGMELRGMPFYAMFENMARPELQERMDHVFDGPAICRLQLATNGEDGLPARNGRALILPLGAADGAADLALACLVTAGHVGRPPRRFVIEDAAAMPVPGLRKVPVLKPGWQLPVPDLAMAGAVGFAEAPAEFGPTPKGRPDLKIVRS